MKFPCALAVVIALATNASAFTAVNRHPMTTTTTTKTTTTTTALSAENIASNILDLVGNTPLIQLNRVTDGAEAQVIAKLESQNPANSVKDRIAMSMILEAEKRGDIKPGETILVEPTSGNTGIGLAMVAAARGYELKLTMPESMSMERRVLLKAFGAEVILTPAAKGMGGGECVEKQTDRKRFDWWGSGTVPFDHHHHHHHPVPLPRPKKLWENWDPKECFCSNSITLIIQRCTAKRRKCCASYDVGTGGTLTGSGQYLKEKNPNLKIVAIEPVESPVLSGGKPGPHKIQGIGAGFIPGNADTSLFDEVIQISGEDAMDMARRMAKEEGIFCGISSGASVLASVQVAKRKENKGKRIVCIIPSFGERYLSTALFANLWDEAAAQKAESVDA
eukprot:scaffold1081_cov136-Amphora_coffeaeformis.AAC.3